MASPGPRPLAAHTLSARPKRCPPPSAPAGDPAGGGGGGSSPPPRPPGEGAMQRRGVVDVGREDELLDPGPPERPGPSLPALERRDRETVAHPGIPRIDQDPGAALLILELDPPGIGESALAGVIHSDGDDLMAHAKPPEGTLPPSGGEIGKDHDDRPMGEQSGRVGEGT